MLWKQALLDSKAKIDSQRSNGTTALNISCEHGHFGAVVALVNRGASVELADKEVTLR
jgi:ankyrin repeat protein